MAQEQDPVCGETVDAARAEAAGLFSDFDGKRFWFGSIGCKTRFDERPTAYTLAEEEWRASTEGMSEPYPIPPNID